MREPVRSPPCLHHLSPAARSPCWKGTRQLEEHRAGGRAPGSWQGTQQLEGHRAGGKAHSRGEGTEQLEGHTAAWHCPPHTMVTTTPMVNKTGLGADCLLRPPLPQIFSNLNFKTWGEMGDRGLSPYYRRFFLSHKENITLPQ